MVTDTYSYDAYGNLIASTGTTVNPYLFTGQWFDAAIGQYYLRARDYSPSDADFTSRDPYGGRTSVPTTQNHYLYANADPVDGTDPSGFTTTEEGKAAHKIIARLYEADHLGSLIFSSNKPFRGGDVLLADIINVTGLDTTTGMLAEIKTPGEASLGQTQLRGYLEAYNASRPFNKSWIRDSFWNPTMKEFWLGAADPALGNSFGTIIGNYNGVIVYTTYTVRQPPPLPIPLTLIQEATATVYSRSPRLRPQPIFALPRLPPPPPAPYLPRDL